MKKQTRRKLNATFKVKPVVTNLPEVRQKGGAADIAITIAFHLAVPGLKQKMLNSYFQKN